MNFIKSLFQKSKKGAFFNSSDYEMRNFFCGIGESEIKANEIIITKYPFKPSIAYPSKTIGADEIHFIHAKHGLCRLYVQNDIIFISQELKDELIEFANTNRIELIEHSWNWDWILEPYVDTEFTDETEKRISKCLSEVGIDELETQKLRNEVSTQMYKYNFDTLLWDWCSLGLHDVLSAMRVKYDEKEFADFYKRAIEIDKRGKNTLRNDG